MVVAIHYTLKDDAGEVIDSSDGGEPLCYLAGEGNIIPGLDRELTGLVEGDEKDVVVQPEDGYGLVDDALIQKIPADMFGGVEKVEVGMSFQAESPEGDVQLVEVVGVDDDGITVDANHALAGKVLHFSVKIDSVREASEGEISHGHVH